MIGVRAAMMRRSSEAVEALDEADSPVEGLEEGTLAIQSNGKHITGYRLIVYIPKDRN